MKAQALKAIAAIQHLYRVTMALALLGLLIVSFMPETPLKRTHHPTTPIVE